MRYVASRAIAGITSITALCLALIGAGPADAEPTPQTLQPGVVYTGEARYHDVALPATTCGYPDGSGTLYAAVSPKMFGNSRACGVYLAVTGPKGTSVRVMIVDLCAGCHSDDLVLSRKAFESIGPFQDGRLSISWKVTDADPDRGLTYRFEKAPAPTPLRLQPGNSRYPVHTVE